MRRYSRKYGAILTVFRRAREPGSGVGRLHIMDYPDFDGLSDDELLSHLEELARKEKQDLAHFLGCLAAIDDRGAHKKRGFSSSFDYLTQRLHYSADEAYRRVSTARAADLFPAIYSMLKDGTLTLTGASRLAPHLTRENASELLARAENKSTRAIEELLAVRFPKAETADRVRALKGVASPALNHSSPSGPPAPDPTAATPRSAGPETPPQLEPPAPALAVPEALSASQATRPMQSETAAERFEFSFTGSRALRQAIERARDILWHKYPWDRMEDVLMEALRFYLERHDPQIRLLPETKSVDRRVSTT